MDSAWNRMNQDEAREIMQRVEFRYRRINRYLFPTVPLGPGLPITRATVLFPGALPIVHILYCIGFICACSALDLIMTNYHMIKVTWYSSTTRVG
jgi:hypothetical protein